MSNAASFRPLAAAAAFLVALAGVFASVAQAAPEDSQSSYTDSVRAALNRGKRFPTGRDVSIDQPSGRAEVTFVLDRRGKVRSAKVTRSSNSIALDDQARGLVRRARYAAFPSDAWAGMPTETFVVTYDFSRDEKKGTVTVGEPVEVTAR